MAQTARFSAGHEERFRDEASGVHFSKEESGKRRFKAVAYTGVDVSRFWGRMVVDSNGIQRDERMGMLLEHNDYQDGVAVCDKHEVDESGKVELEGYFLSEKASDTAKKVLAAADEGWPWKMSIGIRFLETRELEPDEELEVNGRTFKGPMTVVTRSRLFETSFIRCSPADLDTEATVMRAAQQERPMAAPNDSTPPAPQGASLSEADKEKLRQEGVDRERAATKAREEAMKAAFPKRPKFTARMLASGKSVDEAREIDRQNHIGENKKLKATLKSLGHFSHTGEGHVPGTGTIDTDRNVAGLSAEKRVEIEVLEHPVLADLWGERSLKTLLSLHKVQNKRSTSGAPLLTGNPRTSLSLEQMAHDLAQVARTMESERGHPIGPITKAQLEAFARSARLGIGKVGPDLSKITVKGFIGSFYTAYEESLSKNLFADVSYQLESDQEAEIIRWLDAPPQLQEFKGARVAKGLTVRTQLLQNKLFESTIRVDKFYFAEQKFGLIDKSFGEYGGVTSQHWDIIFAQLLEANGTAYDTFNMFSRLHTLGGDSGVMTNDLTSGQGFSSLAIADPNLPTQIEAARILMQCVPHMQEFAWANGIKMNGSMQKVIVVVPVKWKGIFQAAVSSERLDTGQTNPLNAMKEMFEVRSLAYLTSTNPYVYVLRVDTPNKPYLRAEPQPITMLWQGPGSHFEFVEHCYAMGLESIRGIANGAWESALRLTLGAAA